jgi:hypothetical protein
MKKGYTADILPRRLQLHASNTIHPQAANNAPSKIFDDKQLLVQHPTKNGEEM